MWEPQTEWLRGIYLLMWRHLLGILTFQTVSLQPPKMEWQLITMPSSQEALYSHWALIRRYDSDTNNKTKPRSNSLSQPVSALCFNPAVPGLIVTGSTDKTIKFWNISGMSDIRLLWFVPSANISLSRRRQTQVRSLSHIRPRQDLHSVILQRLASPPRCRWREQWNQGD